MPSNKILEPLAYQVGWVPFINTKIYLDSRPLIPRTETEHWVNEVIQEMRRASGSPQPTKVLDLCAGSGCIGVALLQELPESTVDFVEIDESHHKTIQKNIEENEIDPSRTRILGGDLFENVTHKYDIILSNPPYINRELVERVEKSVRAYEPERALYGGKGGTEVIERIITNAPTYLNPGGVLYIEHEPEQVETISRYPTYVCTIEDQYGVPRLSKLVL